MGRVILGKTALEANQLGFGGIPIQRVDEGHAVETVLYAVEKGIDFIDTARMYTTSEERIGKALVQTDKRVTLASKTPRKRSDEARKDVEISLKNLRRGYIDLYQCHGVRDEKDYGEIISPGGALEGLMEAKEEGLIGHIGITSHSLDLLERVVEEGSFETVMVCFSFLEPKALEKVIPDAIRKEMGVIAMKPFSGGVIDNPKIALKWALSHPGILVLGGVEHKEFVDQNWEVFHGSYDLSPEERQEIRDIQKEYDRVFCRRCDYCQPCSEEIPIQMVLGLRSMVKRMGNSAFASPFFKAITSIKANAAERQKPRPLICDVVCH